MPYRTIISIAVAAVLGIACFATDALAYRAVYRGGGVHVAGVYRGGAYRGAGVYRGAYVRRGVAVGVGAATVVAPRHYYNSAACGYHPSPPCY
jgi:hypothetical protein